MLHPLAGLPRLSLTVMIVLLFPMCVTGDASGQPANQQSLADVLVDAAASHHARRDACEREVVDLKRELEALEVGLRAGEASLASTQAGRPELKNAWKRLEIGEFESEADFAQRRIAAKQREQQDHEASEREWKERLSAQQAALEAIRREVEARARTISAETKALEARIFASIWELPELPSSRRVLSFREISLPRFDRESMSFGPIKVPPSGVTELRSSRPGNLVARIEETVSPTIRITLPSLEAARLFKERFEAGEISCVVVGGLELSPASPESPILVQPQVVRMEETTDYVAATLSAAAVVFRAMNGASDEELQSIPAPDPILKSVVVQPEVKEAGTRYHFTMSPEAVIFVDQANADVKEAAVSFLDEFPRVTSIRSDAQPASRVLRPGDRIVRVGDRETRGIRALRTAIRSYKAGQAFEVTYRRPGIEADLSFEAEGGKPLGVDLE